jgi:hypothetical protein
MWKVFNTAWLGLLQRQKDLSIELQDQQRHFLNGETLISTENLEKMGDNLVRLCDSLEQHGLVDYEMGVLEEEIIERMFPYIDTCPSKI